MVHLLAGPAAVTLTAPGAPLLANALRVAPDGGLPRRPRRVDPRVGQIPEPIRARAPATALVETLCAETTVGATRRGRDGLALLVGALAGRDPRVASRAAEALLGLGPGLTPEGDDLLAAGAIAVAAGGRAAGVRPAERRRLAAALCPAAASRRTTRLSATLLRLAAVGAAPEALGRVVAGEGSARRELARLGETSGRALLAGTDASLRALSCRARG